MPLMRKSCLTLIPLYGGLMLTNTAFAAINVPMSNTPLAGLTQSFPANVYLTLSVEFPTAGAAYNSKTTLNTDADLKVAYRGYFDSNKCYVYNTNGYFEPVAAAKTTNGFIGICNSSTDNQFSGNILNWFSMTALDVYRSTMTGGNRALGADTQPVNYSSGDTTSFTSLRRANVVSGQNKNYQLTNRKLTFSKNTIKQYLPHTYISNPNKNGSDTITVTANNDTFNVTIQGTSNLNTGLAAVVQVCKSGFLEANCSKYGNSYKPEGLMQKNVNKMNFSALGYLNISGSSTSKTGGKQISGGVVRSELGSILSEFNQTTGQYVVNPFPQGVASATGAAVDNSGSMNYLNKFGDANAYKTNDPVAELYYTALRYMRGMGYVNNVNWMPNSLTKAEKDNFPVIDIKNKDPYKTASGTWDVQKVCSKNTIMLIGDTNSHQDGNLPNLDSDNGYMPSYGTKATDDPINTAAYIDKLIQSELAYMGAAANSTFMDERFKKGGNTGSSRSPGGLPALAFWANTQNMRTDAPSGHKVTAQTFAIDVLEASDYKVLEEKGTHWVRNAYYLAAKYGGFTAQNENDTPKNTDPAKWTNDPIADGKVISSISQFKYGKPKNYALANNPDSMVDALNQAFNSVSAAANASQTGIAIATGDTVLDMDNDSVIQSTYKDSNWSGDIKAFKLAWNKASQGWDRVEGVPGTWSANELLKSNTNRYIFAYNGTSAQAFTSGNAGAFTNLLGVSGNDAQNLIDYVRGGSSNELDTQGNGKYRARLGDKMGTVVNSQVVSIPQSKQVPAGCGAYADASATNRNTIYGVASNDGMYHVFDNTGGELYAYIPSTALPKLAAYADPAYTHQYLNDGMSTYAEACVNNVATSVIVGTSARGGKSVYALDVTNAATVNDNFLWEFNQNDDADLGHFIGKPIITKDHAGNDVAIISSGYNTTGDAGYLYVLNLNKAGSSWNEGVNYRKIRLGNSGVGAPFAYDGNADGVVDTVYVGDLDGKLWKVVNNASGWSNPFTDAPMYQTNQAAGAGKGITSAPFAQVVYGKLTVFIGTGRYLDETDFDTNVQNYALGIFDNGTQISHDDLLTQTLMAENDHVAGYENLWLITENAMTADKKGWKVALRPGQMIVDQPKVHNKKAAYFTVFTPTPNDNCLTTSATYILGVDARDGSLYDEPLFDSNKDGVVDDNDVKAAFYKLGDMLGPIGTLVQTTDGRVLFTLIGADGTLHIIDLNPLTDPVAAVVKRLSWREIF